MDQIKADMRAGLYAFSEPRARIAGWRDAAGTYHVNEGNHRMAAALELLGETGDPKFILELLRCGLWTDITSAPAHSRPMPTRRWIGRLRNWLGY